MFWPGSVGSAPSRLCHCSFLIHGHVGRSGDGDAFIYDPLYFGDDALFARPSVAVEVSFLRAGLRVGCAYETGGGGDVRGGRAICGCFPGHPLADASQVRGGFCRGGDPSLSFPPCILRLSVSQYFLCEGSDERSGAGAGAEVSRCVRFGTWDMGTPIHCDTALCLRAVYAPHFGSCDRCAGLCVLVCRICGRGFLYPLAVPGSVSSPSGASGKRRGLDSWRTPDQEEKNAGGSGAGIDHSRVDRLHARCCIRTSETAVFGENRAGKKDLS